MNAQEQLGFTPYFFPVKKNVSVLLPTRGRREALKRSVMSLVETATDATKIEIILGFDNDDSNTQQWFMENVVTLLKDSDVVIKILNFERLGYGRLNEYVNNLARYAEGRWFLFWNDDAWMETSGWDDEIIKYNGKFRVLRIPTHNEHPYAIFPIIPREWLRLFGYLSFHQLSDAWISQIGYMLNIIENISVSCVHDRADLTGNNEDETFKEGAIHQVFEGNPSDPRDFNHINYTKKRHEDCDRIAWYLSEKGEDMSWWINVLAGKQNPWDYMLSDSQDPNKQIGIQK